ncbi:MAG TPA: saccharopine dehydrogenase family protein [bacterium]|nr:saccharopine dehydrogenase family protein [bacterium]
MARVLIIGAGGVGSVVAHKCAQAREVFADICLASRTVAKCGAVRASIRERYRRNIGVAALDADKPRETVRLIREFRPDVVINVALPYQDLAIMDACLITGVDYLDTANYEPRDQARFEYKWQWAYKKRFRERGIMALLGSGFDPGVTNVFCAHALKHRFDEIASVDIIDCNAGDHGHPFATNFNPEINIREVTQKGRYWERGRWVTVAPMSMSRELGFPAGIGVKRVYLLYHEEMESLSRNLASFGLKRMRFWMTFSERYLTYLKVLQDVGMTKIEPVMYEGRAIVPLQFLKAVLPDPGSLGKTTRGKTCIGCLVRGKKGGRDRAYYIYNICDHEACYQEVGSQAISYTTGVPAMIGAMLMVTGKWKRPGVFNMEEFDPDPFMALLGKYGLPWKETMAAKFTEQWVKALERG